MSNIDSNLVRNTEGYFKLLGINPSFELATTQWLADLTVGNIYYKKFGDQHFEFGPSDCERKVYWQGFSWQRVPDPTTKFEVIHEEVIKIGDEVITDGLKNDFGKTLMSLLFTGCPEALAGAAGVLTFGAQKYEAHSWKEVEAARYLDAFYRHMYKCHIGEELDPDSGLMHIDHALTNLLFIRELMAGGDNPFELS